MGLSMGQTIFKLMTVQVIRLLSKTSNYRQTKQRLVMRSLLSINSREKFKIANRDYVFYWQSINQLSINTNV